VPPTHDDEIDHDHGLDDDLFDDDDGVDAYDTVPCPSCGRPVADEAEWCPHCGDWLVNRVATANRRRRVLFAIVVLAGVVGLVRLATC
jgi:hypothetical protein